MLPEQLKTKASKTSNNSEGGDKRFSHSGIFIAPEHLTFEEKEFMEANDKKIMAAKYELFYFIFVFWILNNFLKKISCFSYSK